MSLGRGCGLFFALMVALLAVAAGGSTAVAPASSLAVSPVSPVFGDTVTLTAVYPGEARKKVGRQQMNQPQIGVYCYQSGTLVWAAFTSPGDETNLGGGWWTGTASVTLGGTGNGYTWTGGAASCFGLLGYYTTKDLIYQQLASVSFDVAAA